MRGERERVLPSRALSQPFVQFVELVAACFVQFVRFVACFFPVPDTFHLTKKKRPNLPVRLTEYDKKRNSEDLFVSMRYNIAVFLADFIIL